MAQKVKNDPNIKSKSKVIIERNIENENCSTSGVRLVQTRPAMPREALASPYICHFSKLNIDFDFAVNFVSLHCIASVSLLKTSKNFGRHF